MATWSCSDALRSTFSPCCYVTVSDDDQTRAQVHALGLALGRVEQPGI
tara:strand:+ start:77 stop:220 length:144 start_codon:yes stop_codon:yes gene_type:complete